MNELIVSREAFLKPLQAVMGVVETRQTLPILSYLLCVIRENSVEITGTDLEVELSVVLDTDILSEKNFSMMLPAKKLLDICRTLPEGARLSVKNENEKLRISSGSSRFLLSTLSTENFPRFDSEKFLFEIRIGRNELKGLFEKVAFAMAQNDVRYYLNGLITTLNSDSLQVLASNGHRLASADLLFSEKNSDISEHHWVIPRKAVLEVLQLIQLAADAEFIVLKGGASSLNFEIGHYSLHSKLIDSKFPDLRKVIHFKPGIELIVDRDALKAALVRASVLSSEKFNVVSMCLRPNEMILKAKNSDQEIVEEHLEVDYTGTDLEIAFNVYYVLDILNALTPGAFRWSLLDEKSSMMIESVENSQNLQSRYVVMPVRL